MRTPRSPHDPRDTLGNQETRRNSLPRASIGASRRFWIEHYDSNGVISYLTTSRTTANACRVLEGFMPGVEGDIDSEMLVRLVPPGDKAGVMCLLPLKLSHPPDGRIALPATVVFRAASYRHPSERPEPRLIDEEYRLIAWPIESNKPFVVWHYAAS